MAGRISASPSTRDHLDPAPGRLTHLACPNFAAYNFFLSYYPTPHSLWWQVRTLRGIINIITPEGWVLYPILAIFCWTMFYLNDSLRYAFTNLCAFSHVCSLPRGVIRRLLSVELRVRVIPTVHIDWLYLAPGKIAMMYKLGWRFKCHVNSDHIFLCLYALMVHQFEGTWRHFKSTPISVGLPRIPTWRL